MAVTISVKLDDEQEILLSDLLKARRDKCRSRIIREALWCYAEKILPDLTPIGVTSASATTKKRGQDEN